MVLEEFNVPEFFNHKIFSDAFIYRLFENDLIPLKFPWPTFYQFDFKKMDFIISIKEFETLYEQ